MDRGAIATAHELLAARHFPGVIAVVTELLEHAPESIELLVLRARAQLGLRRTREAQNDLRDIIRLDPTCAIAYRLLGQLAAHRDENEPAAIFFREALRLAPNDHEAADWLAIVQATSRPAAVAQKLPAPATAAGRFPRGTESPPEPQPRLAAGLGSGEGRRAAGSSPSLPRYRSAVSESPGFGDFLVRSGILTRERLRAAQAYQRSTRVQLATAIVTLGLATVQRVEWALVAHRAEKRAG